MGNKIRAACAIGWPIKHSRSPLIHGHWIEKHGIAGDYRLEGVTPEDFPNFIANLAGHGYVGCNITIPHKEVALKLSEPDERARAIGAANTLWLDGDRLRSTNTDVVGFIGNLDVSAPGWDKDLENAIVLGAGGAARAVVYGFIERGVKNIHVVNRTISKAEAFRQHFGDSVHPASWDDLPRLLGDAGMLANTTSLGMADNPDLVVDLDLVGDDTVVADAVYVPLKTSLLTAAEGRGLRIADGLGMLLHQATRPFELWWGLRPEVTPELRALVERELLAG
jgi:shikimate dehydrogenase